jgi:hypothetical protein
MADEPPSVADARVTWEGLAEECRRLADRAGELQRAWRAAHEEYEAAKDSERAAWHQYLGALRQAS